MMDFLTYRSWWYQIYLYGMSKEKARQLYANWEQFEEYDDERKNGSK